MRFMTGDPEVPVLVRLARNLLLVQSGILFFDVLFIVIVRLTLSAQSGGTTTSGDSFSSGAAVVLFLVGAVILGVVAVKVGRLVEWARWTAIGLEVLMVVGMVITVRSSNAVSLVIYVALAGGVIACLFSDGARRAFATRGEDAEPVATTAPDSAGSAVTPAVTSSGTPPSDAEKPEALPPGPAADS